MKISISRTEDHSGWKEDGSGIAYDDVEQRWVCDEDARAPVLVQGVLLALREAFGGENLPPRRRVQATIFTDAFWSAAIVMIGGLRITPDIYTKYNLERVPTIRWHRCSPSGCFVVERGEAPAEDTLAGLYLEGSLNQYHADPWGRFPGLGGPEGRATGHVIDENAEMYAQGYFAGLRFARSLSAKEIDELFAQMFPDAVEKVRAAEVVG